MWAASIEQNCRPSTFVVLDPVRRFKWQASRIDPAPEPASPMSTCRRELICLVHVGVCPLARLTSGGRAFMGNRSGAEPLGQSGNLQPDFPERPPWLTEEQYCAFKRNFSLDLGAQCMTAWSVGVEDLDADRRRDLLNNFELRSTLVIVCTMYARLDAAAQRSREGEVEKHFVRSVGGDLADTVGRSLQAGNRLMPPPAMNQLIREVIEWCSGGESDSDQRDGNSGGPAVLGGADIVRMVLSINGDQERQHAPEYFDSWPPSAEELQKYNEAMTVDDEMVLRELQRQMLPDFARMQTNAITLPVMVLGDTYDTWFKGWPPVAPHDLIGDTPPVAFAAATGVALREFISLGLRRWEHGKSGHDKFTKSWLLDASVNHDVIAKMQKTLSMPVAKYRKRLEGERKKGYLA